ncbi:MAG: hypothetical protein LBR44_02700 [Clostridiales Family XIII bacterium]|jgi:hypothetical protein|nr:hypothetical protein [Clostridiales Family XIII bacterium]
MKYYISHRAAAEYWKIPNLEWILGDVNGGARKDACEGDGGNIGVKTRPSDVCFFRAGSRFDVKGRVSHHSKLALPHGSILIDGEGLWVASPELTFLQMAETLDTVRLVLLGLQMCGHSVGRPEMARTTKRKIAALVAQTGGHRGHRNAEKALKYLADGSGSIMESLAYMALTLPAIWGGYGLSGATFNHEIALTPGFARQLGQHCCFADLFYGKENVAVEYQSRAFHGTEEKQGKDLQRASVLERQGIDVMMLSTIQLYDKDSFRVFAENLAARLGRRLQIRAKCFGKQQAALRQLFPTKPADRP